MVRLNRSLVLISTISLAGATLAAQSANRASPHAGGACSNAFAFQVLLDRQGFSTGEIDGSLGPNVQHAIAAFQQSHGLPATGSPDCATWSALGGTTDEVVTTYKITASDMDGPFATQIPEELDRQATLPALPYRSVTESLAERFHVAPAMLTRLNKRKLFQAGTSISVPNVTAFDADAKPARQRGSRDIHVEVSKNDSSVRVVGADGSLLFFAPVSSGSEHDPLPAGQWKVTSVSWLPTFHYNPELFWDAESTDAKATIKPGPNNPVGVVWIGIDAPHYGLHGTPEPSRIGHTESHGCVRLTNWDAAHVAGLVAVGTPVIFK